MPTVPILKLGMFLQSFMDFVHLLRSGRLAPTSLLGFVQPHTPTRVSAWALIWVYKSISGLLQMSVARVSAIYLCPTLPCCKLASPSLHSHLPKPSTPCECKERDQNKYNSNLFFGGESDVQLVLIVLPDCMLIYVSDGKCSSLSFSN